MKRSAAALLVLFFVASAAFAAGDLRVISAGPAGEIQTLGEASEIRVVFSEPMVAIAQVPANVVAPFFRIMPAVKGSFRWAGTTTLIFTPDLPLPYATKYDVSVDMTAKSIDGSTLDKPYHFSFTTPTVRLMRTAWYRKGGQSDKSIVIGLWFNQPVDAKVISDHLSLRTVSHEPRALDMSAATRALLQKRDPQAIAAFEAKRAKAIAAAASNGARVFASLATEWNVKQWPKVPELLVFETKPGVVPNTWLQVFLDDQLVQGANRVRTGRTQQYTIQLEETFFAGRLYCEKECDPDQRNAIAFFGPGVRWAELKDKVTVTDITDPAKETVVKPESREREYDYPSNDYGLDELGYSLLPSRKYLVRVDPTLVADDGQKLGYTWMATIENSRRSAFVSFGSGHGVWESSGGTVLPLHVRNLKSIQQWIAPLTVDEIMPAIQKIAADYKATPKAAPVVRKLNLTADKISAIGFDTKPAVGKDGKGVVWAVVQPLEPFEGARVNSDPRSTIVQVTNLGLSVKDSPLNTLILVTTLDDAKPVAGANVAIRDKANKVLWSGTTDERGIAVAPTPELRKVEPQQNQRTPRAGEFEEEYDDISWRALQGIHFIVTAEKDGDLAYVGSDWNENIIPWEFGTDFNLTEARPLLRGKVFTDRGVYKLGEEAQMKVIVRTDTPAGMKLLPAGTKVDVVVRDSQNKEVDKRTVTLNEWSSANWTFKVPVAGALGGYTVYTRVPGQRLQLFGDFLVAAYRRPEFRVDATLTAPNSIAGVKLDGRVVGRYLYGGAMNGAAVNIKATRRPGYGVPDKIADRWSDRFYFLGWGDNLPEVETVKEEAAQLDAKGELKFQVESDLKAGWPYDYTIEGEVADVTRQTIAGRATFRVDPAPWYIGVEAPSYFEDVSDGLDTQIIAAALDGLLVPNVKVKVALKRYQWNSVRQSEGDGFYDWETERKEIPAGEWTITTKSEPVPLHIDLKDGGEYELTATATDAKGRTTSTRTYFYAVGAGYTAWERYDHNRIDLIADKKSYKPGDTARIMIKSPWEQATALLTTEREGVRTWTPFELTSTQQTITVPVTDKDIPNVFVSVLLLKGRTKKDPGKDGSDPGKPAFRLGYVELTVDDETKRLAVDVKANKEEFRPATKAKIDVTVKDVTGKPSQSEVTLWAVDYGVLSLTGYRTPDVLEDIYLRKALQVVNEESRQRIVSRRVMEPKGATDGGGGGADAGPGTLRKDFRVLAFWLGSLVTDKNGKASTEVTLPESLTTYRIMAVAADRESRFGWAQNEIRINKPLMLTAAFPRFMSPGDKALFGAVVHNRLKSAGSATVSIKSLDPSIISFAEEKQTVSTKAGSSTEVRFNATAHGVGTARIQMRVAMGRESDAFEETIPVRAIAPLETFAAYGDVKTEAREALELPKDVIPNFGGMRVELASTAMVGLGEGTRYLVEYPYGCAEQKSSKTLALMLYSDLGAAFELPGIDHKKGKAFAASGLDELRTFQCVDGGFSFWPGQCKQTSPYLTANIVNIMHRARTLGYKVDKDTLDRAYAYLETHLNEPKPENEGWMPVYTSWQAFTVKVLAEGGRNVDSHITRLHGYIDRMPVYALAFLVDALVAKKEQSPRLDELNARIKNAVRPEAATAFVQELNDPYLHWHWSSNVRSTAIVLGTLVRQGRDEELSKRMVRWLMQVRKGERWSNTQENAWALASLIGYYRKYEAEAPDFTGVVALGQETIVSETFKGRSTEARAREFSMKDVLAKGTAGQQLPVVIKKSGAGTLFYMLRLRYARSAVKLDAMDAGFRVSRRYRKLDTTTDATSFKGGDLIEVLLTVRATKESRFVAMTDPIPAGTEPVESWFATTRSDLAERVETQAGAYPWAWWYFNGFDFVERHDDRVNVFATRLAQGEHTYRYLLRATTAGTFATPPVHVEQMYEPEVFGRTASTTVEVKP
jgi:uncharacterized protein YfaS (alpha-2-macroglobulin family)